MDSTNDPTGFDVDLISAVAANLGLKAQIVTTAWDGIIPALQAQKFEAVISAMTITPDREKEVLFSTPYYRSDMGIVFDKTLHTIAGPDALAGLRVGVQIGTTGETSARLISGLTDVRSYPDIQLAMTDLDLGRIDAVVNDYPVCAYYARDSAALSVVRVLTINQTDLTQYYGIALKRDDTQLKAAIDQALADLVKDGTYDTLYAKWFGGLPDFRPGDARS
jgi:polar amino acid transport system substrate-binding protein